MKVTLCGGFLLSAALLLGGCQAEPRKPAAAAAVDACAMLGAPGGVAFTAPPNWVEESATLPRFCRVQGLIERHVRFEMRLPEKWNGRFMMAGCGGFCGSLLPDKPGYGNSINAALKRGYAAIAHDGGHEAPDTDTAWTSDPRALQLWAQDVLPVVAQAGVALATALYGRPPKYRYFSGCSNGGRLGLVAAQRYPDLFDGIAAGGAIFDLSGLAGLWGNWLIRNNEPAGAPLFPSHKVALVEKLAMKQCDAVDGQLDGIIDDPRACRVDFEAAICPAGTATSAECLTAVEANELNALYGGVRDDSGVVIYPGPEFGSERYSDLWLFGAVDRPAWGALASAGYRRLLAASLGADDAPHGLPTGQLLDWIRRSPVPALTDATNPDLSGIRKAGGKLLIYQGWADPLIIPRPITAYYERATAMAGGPEQLRDTARLFMVPGWGHCWERPANAPDQFDPMAELEKWVEHGQAPDSIVARQLDREGNTVRSRPICAYPATARLQGGLGANRHESYRCVADDVGGAN